MPQRRLRSSSKQTGRKPSRRKPRAQFSLPENRRTPSEKPWEYAYLLTGEKKIGKTTLAIEGAEELVLQFDKPQLAYAIREVMLESWADTLKTISALEAKAAQGKFEFDRIIVDGAGEMYQMCQIAVCKHFGVEHPSEEGFARAWHKLRDDFTSVINRLLRLQNSQGCGLIFIAHSEWKERTTRGGSKIECLVPNLPSRAEEILNGKCDAWFQYDYHGSNRIMIIRGDEQTAAGHRIDGHFETTDGRQVREIPMGSNATEAMEQFERAFRNEMVYADITEEVKANRAVNKAKAASTPKKRVTKKRTKRASSK